MMLLFRGIQKAGSIYIDIPPCGGDRRSLCLCFRFGARTATALRVAIDPYVVGVPFITFFPAVVITTVISGFVPAFFGVVLSTLQLRSSCCRRVCLCTLKPR